MIDTTCYYYYYSCIYNARTFSTESKAPAVGTGGHGKGVDGLFENVNLQTAFEGGENG